MEVAPWVYSAAAVIVGLIILFLVVVFVLTCIHLLWRPHLYWGCSVIHHPYKPEGATLNNVKVDNFEEETWLPRLRTCVSSRKQIDVNRIMSRREQRYKHKEMNREIEGEDISRTVDKLDNETATVLAVEQLLDNSFIISDEELGCYAPPTKIHVIGARRDRV